MGFYWNAGVISKDEDKTVEPDHKKAYDYFNQASILGHKQASLELAFCFWLGRGTTQSMRMGTEAAERVG